ncbi:hypothetical protein [Nocardia sp. CA-290969]|uniref:hypothetical protein n=1 Tax=Nocardia sp. CA-290969 TaxID=3239986 RepID=UPI003D8C4E43
MNLLTDLSSLRIAPTVGREVAAQLVALLLIAAIAIPFGGTPVVQFGLPALYAVYALVRIAIAARRKPADVQ